MAEQQKKPAPKIFHKKKLPRKVNTTTAKLLGYYSVDEDRNFFSDSSQLLYFKPPSDRDVKLDLDEGIEFAVRRKETFAEEGIDLLLEWLKKNFKKLLANPLHGRRLQPKFVCTRGTLTRILKTPGAPNKRWTIYATNIQGTVYLCADKTVDGGFALSDETDRYSSWGHKFEQYVFSDSPNKAPDTSKPVLEPAEFRCVYQRRIGKHPVLFSAVMKGVCSDKILKNPSLEELQKLTFVETKTSKLIEHDGHERTLRKHKFLTYWSQCFLTDTPEILCGFRDQSGVVQNLKLYKVFELVEMSKPFWNPKDCIDFCETVLTKIYDTLNNEPNLTITKFENIPNEGIVITKLSSECQYSFIPETYLQALI